MTTVGDLSAELSKLEKGYELLGELSRDETVTVYVARDRLSGNEVAVKVLRAGDARGREALAHYASDARLLTALEHPNIVTVHAVKWLSENVVAVITERVRGPSLRQVLDVAGTLPVARANEVLKSLGRALAWAHSSQIMHRDMRPENVIFEDGTGRVVLSDFGLARGIRGEEASSADAYRAPELADGRYPDRRTDVYSLGIVGWELLTGRRPWPDTLEPPAAGERSPAPPPLAAVRPGLPEALVSAIEGAVQLDRDRRIPDVTAFMDRLTGVAPPPRPVPEAEEADAFSVEPSQWVALPVPKLPSKPVPAADVSPPERAASADAAAPDGRRDMEREVEREVSADGGLTAAAASAATAEAVEGADRPESEPAIDHATPAIPESRGKADAPPPRSRDREVARAAERNVDVPKPAPAARPARAQPTEHHALEAGATAPEGIAALPVAPAPASPAERPATPADAWRRRGKRGEILPDTTTSAAADATTSGLAGESAPAIESPFAPPRRQPPAPTSAAPASRPPTVPRSDADRPAAMDRAPLADAPSLDTRGVTDSRRPADATPAAPPSSAAARPDAATSVDGAHKAEPGPEPKRTESAPIPPRRRESRPAAGESADADRARDEGGRGAGLAAAAGAAGLVAGASGAAGAAAGMSGPSAPVEPEKPIAREVDADRLASSTPAAETPRAEPAWDPFAPQEAERPVDAAPGSPPASPPAAPPAAPADSPAADQLPVLSAPVRGHVRGSPSVRPPLRTERMRGGLGTPRAAWGERERSDPLHAQTLPPLDPVFDTPAEFPLPAMPDPRPMPADAGAAAGGARSRWTRRGIGIAAAVALLIVAIFAIVRMERAPGNSGIVIEPESPIGYGGDVEVDSLAADSTAPAGPSSATAGRAPSEGGRAGGASSPASRRPATSSGASSTAPSTPRSTTPSAAAPTPRAGSATAATRGAAPTTATTTRSTARPTAPAATPPGRTTPAATRGGAATPTPAPTRTAARPTPSPAVNPARTWDERADGFARCNSPALADQRACISAHLARNDAGLNQVYNDVIAAMRRRASTAPGDPDPPEVQRLRAMQRSWIARRDSECRRRGRGREGPLWAPQRAQCLEEVSQARARELSNTLARLR